MQIPDPFRDIREQMLTAIMNQIRELGGASVSEDDLWFRNLLVALMKSALIDYRHVERGTRETVSIAAMGMRNLMELKVFTEFVLKSESNARKFLTDLLIDDKEFHEAIGRHHKSLHRQMISGLKEQAQTLSGVQREGIEQWIKTQEDEGPDTKASDSAATATQEFLLRMGVKESTRPLRSGEVAQRIGQKAEFDPLFKICSKLMHRTALSIAAETAECSLDGILPMLNASAFGDLLAIHFQVSQHVKAFGIRPVSNK